MSEFENRYSSLCYDFMYLKPLTRRALQKAPIQNYRLFTHLPKSNFLV